MDNNIPAPFYVLNVSFKETIRVGEIGKIKSNRRSPLNSNVNEIYKIE